MSELYGDGVDGPVHPHAPSTTPSSSARSTPGSATSSKAPDWLPLSVICENCGKIGTTLATDWDGFTVAYQCKPDHVDLGHGLRPHRSRCSPFGGRAKLPFNVDWAAKWSLFDITVEGCGKDLATAGGSRDRSDAVSRRGLRSRAAAQRALRVPEHRRQEDEHLQGHGRDRARDRGPAAAGAAALPVPAPQAAQGHRVRPGGRHHPGPVRRVRPHLRGRRRQARARRAAARSRRRILRQSLVDADADVGRRGRPLPAAVPAPGAAGPGAQRGPGGAHGRPRRARRWTRRSRPSSTERARVAGAWLETFAPDRYKVAVQDELPGGRGRPDGGAAHRARARWPRRPTASRPAVRRRVAGPHLRHRRRPTACPPGTRSRPSTLAFLGRLNGPRAGWLLASLERGVRGPASA